MDPRYNQPLQYSQQAARSAYPQVSSPSSMHSTYQSSTSLSSLASMSTSPSQTNMHSRQSPDLSSAPLPSPSDERQPAGGNYFGAMQPTTTPSHVQQYHHHHHHQQQQQASIATQSQQQMPTQHQSQHNHGGGLAETTPYLQGFNLLAEAAKRAEMAVLMRDLDDFEM